MPEVDRLQPSSVPGKELAEMKRSPVFALLASVAALACTVVLAACGGDNNDKSSTSSSSGKLIKSNPANSKVAITVGSKNFTEEFILGQIYAQGLKAAGYKIKTDLNLGDAQIALKALKDGNIDGYPEYTSTALTSFFNVKVTDIPSDAGQAVAESRDKFAKVGLDAFDPTPVTSANAVGMLKKRADELGVTKVSDLEGKSQKLTLYGSPECRQRPDCLIGLEENYGLKFKRFVPVDIGLRYEVLDKGQADLSIIFTTDAQLSTRKDVITLVDDKKVFPPGNVIFVARKQVVDKAGPDMQKTAQLVQQGLTEKVMRELNARVDVDREQPRQVAREYLRESGYIK
jgi:glycine betaine/choline ABC-type transport system substrate-binding protein